MTTLEPLLVLQERDLALARLRHRRDTLAERAVLVTAEARKTDLSARAGALRVTRDEVAREERRLDDEAQALRAQVQAAEQKLYSGEIASPRELQALQADVEQLRRRQRGVEDRQLDAMERREPLDAELAELEVEIARAEEEGAGYRSSLAAAEAEIDAEANAERAARDGVAAGLDDALLDDYERTRAKASGVGAARLIGNTCQGCHLTIPATEVDRIRRGAGGPVTHCDNCGCILVP